jgi:hypothetical protein
MFLCGSCLLYVVGCLLFVFAVCLCCCMCGLLVGCLLFPFCFLIQTRLNTCVLVGCLLSVVGCLLCVSFVFVLVDCIVHRDLLICMFVCTLLFVGFCL